MQVDALAVTHLERERVREIVPDPDLLGELKDVKLRVTHMVIEGVVEVEGLGLALGQAEEVEERVLELQRDKAPLELLESDGEGERDRERVGLRVRVADGEILAVGHHVLLAVAMKETEGLLETVGLLVLEGLTVVESEFVQVAGISRLASMYTPILTAVASTVVQVPPELVEVQTPCRGSSEPAQVQG